MSCIYGSGMILIFLYPACNAHGMPKRLERRRVRVIYVRDLAVEPLDPITAVLAPALCRGRWLIVAHDFDRGAERCFYLESMEDVRIEDVSVKDRRVCMIQASNDEWTPPAALPTKFEIEDVVAEQISAFTAELIADHANAFVRTTGVKGYGAAVLKMAG